MSDALVEIEYADTFMQERHVFAKEVKLSLAGNVLQLNIDGRLETLGLGTTVSVRPRVLL